MDKRATALLAKGFTNEEDSSEFTLEIGNTVVSVWLTDREAMLVNVWNHYTFREKMHCYNTVAAITKLVNKLKSTHVRS